MPKRRKEKIWEGENVLIPERESRRQMENLPSVRPVRQRRTRRQKLRKIRRPPVRQQEMREEEPVHRPPMGNLPRIRKQKTRDVKGTVRGQISVRRAATVQGGSRQTGNGIKTGIQKREEIPAEMDQREENPAAENSRRMRWIRP